MDAPSCDIFCTVIDNLGDAGVCWRLARQLAVEQGWRVRLWIDDPAPIALLAPDRTSVDVRHWTGDFTGVEASDIVIEAFACALPANYVAAMRARKTAPVWLNLEYLSAEDWVGGCHALPSRQNGLEKFFFFPGFDAATGGLLREQDYAVPPAPTFHGPLQISLFCYANPQLPQVLEAWRNGEQRIACHIADGLPRQQVERWLGESFPVGATRQRDQLTLVALPFLPQSGYDQLLGQCHLNFVRGEDSFVRAQWAERPFVWQAYPQAEALHLIKLEAFLQRYLAKVGAGGTADIAEIAEMAVANRAARTAAAFFRAWNGAGALDWPAFAAALPTLAAHAPGWSAQLQGHGDLAAKLVKFCTAQQTARL